MQTPFQPQMDIENLGTEVRSYIYQMLMDFEPFTTPTTSVAVIAKDPLKLLNKHGFEDHDPKKLRHMWRISITLSEDGTKVEEEALHEDIYVAIRMAKDKMVKTLSEIQDDVVTTQDRMMQIQSALAGKQQH